MQTNPAVEQKKALNDPRVRGISPFGEEKVYGGKVESTKILIKPISNLRD